MKGVMSKFAYIELIWAPHKLARIAARSSTLAAIVVGAPFLIIEFGSLVSGQATGGAEPFRDVPNYLIAVVKFSVPVGAVAAALIVIPCSMVILVLRRSAPTEWDPPIRVCVLGLLSLFVPVLVWSFCAASQYSASPNFQYFGPTGKPAWVHLPVFRVLSSDAWWIVGLIAYLANCLFAVRSLPRYRDAGGMPRCEGCEYILTGLTESRCPECGRPFERRVERLSVSRPANPQNRTPKTENSLDLNT